MEYYLTDTICIRNNQMFSNDNNNNNKLIQKYNWHKYLYDYGWRKLPKKWILTPLIDNSPTFCNSLNSLFHNRVFFTGLLFGISASLLDGLAFFIGFLAFGLDTSFIESATFVMSSLTLGSLSFLPAGIGVTEISLLGFLTNHGVSLATASALMLFIRLSTSWYTTIIGIISLKIFLRTITYDQS